MANGAFFATPEQVMEAERQARAQGFGQAAGVQNPLLAGAMGNLGYDIAGAIGGAFGAQMPQSAAVKQAQATQEIASGIDFSDRESVLEAARRATQMQQPGIAAQLVQMAPKAAEPLVVGAQQRAGFVEDGTFREIVSPVTQKAKKEYAYKPGELVEIKAREDIVTAQFDPTAPNVGFGQGMVPQTTAMRFSNRPGVSVNIGGQARDKFYETVAKEEGENFTEKHKAATEAVNALRSSAEAIRLLDSGVITGTGANFLLGMGKALKQTGLYDGEAVENTEAFYANQVKQVGQLITMFGAGTGLSDKDREYAQKAAAGEITMDEQSLRRIIRINQEASRNAIDQFNKKATEVDAKGITPYSLVIDTEGLPLYEKPAAAGGWSIVGVQ